jgi:hypothetical protein
MNSQRIYSPNRSHYQGRRCGIALPIVLVILIVGCFQRMTLANDRADNGKDEVNSSRIIQYRGRMPLLDQKLWGQEVKIKFELYRSPTGGASFWTEERTISVRKDGWVSVDLGEVEPLSDEAFTSPFRFLSIWHDDVDLKPRKQIASLTYVASPYEKNLPLDKYKKYVASALLKARAAAEKAPDREHRLDKMVECGTFLMEQHPRNPATWLKAVETAKQMDARLPSFEEWYGAYDGKPSKQLVAMIGHYEWVIPWVYEPSIHARFHELYRGKPAACYYNELNPQNDYPFRLVTDAPSKGTP